MGDRQAPTPVHKDQVKPDPHPEPPPKKGLAIMILMFRWLRSIWCRLTHAGYRMTAFETYGKVSTYSIECSLCGSTYDVVRPNTPQYAHSGAFGEPDRSRPGRWFDDNGKPLVPTL